MEDVICEVFVIYFDGIVLFVGICFLEEKKVGKCRFMDEVNGFGSYRFLLRIISNVFFK